MALGLAALGCAPGKAASGDRGGGGSSPEPPAEPPAARAPRPVPPSGPPVGWDEGLRLRAAVDVNPDPRVVEIELEARVAPVSFRPGTTTPAWTYDGGVPGPLIRVKVGDRLVVRLTNRLPQETTIHWHGLRVPVEMDGVPKHSGPTIRPGATFTYDFVVPDAGLYWYHPHFESAAQVGDGLYGPLLVEDRDEPRVAEDQVVMLLSDIAVEEDGRLRPHDVGGNLGTLFGREGDVVLVNGRANPVLVGRVGRPQRWRIVNAAKSRYFQLALEGHRFTRIGGDGGLMARPIESERLVVIPGERADVVVVPRGAPGQEIPLRWVPYDRGYGSAFARPEVDVLRFRLAAEPPETPPPWRAPERRIVPIDTTGATPVEIKFTRADVNGKFALGVNGKPAGMDAPFHGRVGETQVWTIGNTIDWDHPFHLHGFFFQVLDADGRPAEPLEWKDTVNIPVKKTVKVAIRYDGRPGMWMFHCHILDHADAGMMGMLHLAP
jgi:FtsP/CotA-like multicopper oxidase with cupredoxin domain